MGFSSSSLLQNQAGGVDERAEAKAAEAAATAAQQQQQQQQPASDSGEQAPREELTMEECLQAFNALQEELEAERKKVGGCCSCHRRSSLLCRRCTRLPVASSRTAIARTKLLFFCALTAMLLPQNEEMKDRMLRTLGASAAAAPLPPSSPLLLSRSQPTHLFAPPAAAARRALPPMPDRPPPPPRLHRSRHGEPAGAHAAQRSRGQDLCGAGTRRARRKGVGAPYRRVADGESWPPHTFLPPLL